MDNKTLRAIYDAMQDAVIIINSEYEIEGANNRSKELFGINDNSIKDKKCYELICKKNAPDENCKFLCCKNVGNDALKENRILEAGGKKFQITSLPVASEKENIEKYAVIFRDVTFQLQTEQTLKHESKKKLDLIEKHKKAIEELQLKNKLLLESESRYKSIFYENKSIMFLLDPKTGKIIDANDSALSYYGYSREKMLTLNINDINILPEEQIKREIEHILKENKNYFLFRHKLANGDIRDVQVYSGNIHINDKEVLYTIVHDITGQSIAKNQLVKSEQQYRMLFEHMNAAFALHEIIVDNANKPVDYRFIECNSTFEKLTGLKVEDIKGKTVLEVLPNTEKYWIETYGKVALEGEPISYTNYAKELKRYYDVKAYSPLKGFFAVTFHDITDQIKAEENLKKQNEEYFVLNRELEKSLSRIQSINTELENAYNMASENEEVLKTIFNTAPVTMMLLNENAEVIEINQTGLEEIKKSTKDVIGFQSGDIYSCVNTLNKLGGCGKGEACKKCKVRGAIEYTITTGNPKYKEEVNINVIINNKVEPKIMLMSTSQFYNKGDKIILVTIDDITKLKEAQQKIEGLLEKTIAQNQEIELNNERLERLFRISNHATENIQELLDIALGEAIKLTRSEMGYIYHYSEDSKEFALNSWSKEAIGVEPQTIYHLEKTGLWEEVVRQRKPIITNDYNAPSPFKQGTSEGHVQLRKFLTIPVFIANKIVAVIGVANKKNDYNDADVRQLTLLMDSVWKIVERRELMEDLKEAKEKAEESDRLKLSFLANMSHEIRTPLNGILGFSSILSSTDELPYATKQRYQSIIDSSVEYLLRIIDDILDISKLESGNLEIIERPFEINPFLRDINTLYETKLLEKGKNINLIQKKLDKEIVLHSDANRLRQVFVNLLDNAIKFTESGSIEYGVYKLENEKIVFCVKDTGIGINKDKHAVIFDRFRQAETDLTRNYSGNGLGLTIVKEIVKLFKGEIWLESAAGKGACFYFSLPYDNQITFNETAKKTDFSTESTKKLKILIVEDNEINLEYLKELLLDDKYDISYVQNGLDSIMMAKEKEFDVILMDIRLPGINGFEAVQKIREFDKKVYIIAQTAYAMETDRKQSLSVGCNDYISKPIKRETLLQKLNALI